MDSRCEKLMPWLHPQKCNSARRLQLGHVDRHYGRVHQWCGFLGLEQEHWQWTVPWCIVKTSNCHCQYNYVQLNLIIFNSFSPSSPLSPPDVLSCRSPQVLGQHGGRLRLQCHRLLWRGARFGVTAISNKNSHWMSLVNFVNDFTSINTVINWYYNIYEHWLTY